MKSQRQLRRDRRTTPVRIDDRDGVSVIRLGSANIWDYGDLGRIREAAAGLFRRGLKRVGVDLAHVGLLPSGFMNMLCGWQEAGAEVYLFAPRPNVQEMLWFRRFAEPAGPDAWRMTCVPPQEVWPDTDRRGATLENCSIHQAHATLRRDESRRDDPGDARDARTGRAVSAAGR